MSSLLRLVQWLRTLVYFAVNSDEFQGFSLFEVVGLRLWIKSSTNICDPTDLYLRFEFSASAYRPHIRAKNVAHYLVTSELMECEMLPLEAFPPELFDSLPWFEGDLKAQEPTQDA